MISRLYTGTGLIAAAALFLGINIIANEALTIWRLDVTDDKLFTLSEGSVNIVGQIQEPITIRFYYSARQLAGIPVYLNHGKRVRDLLEEYEARSGGKLRLSVIDPDPFSEVEDQAVAFGIQQLPISAAGDMAYMGLVGTNSTDEQELIAFLSPDREQALEYDITKMIYSLANPSKRTIGVISDLPVFGMPSLPMAGPSASQNWMIVSLLQEMFEVRQVVGEFDAIDEDIDTLLVVHPKNLAPSARYAIDQFILHGGKAMIFVDPMAEQDQAQPNPGAPMVMPAMSSDLPELFASWGINLVADKVIGDPLTAVRVRNPTGSGPQIVDYLPWLGLTDDHLNRDDFATNQLESVNVGSAGAIEVADDAAVNVIPLISSSEQAGLLDRNTVQFMRDPAALLQNFTPDDQSYLIAARIHGEVSTAFPDGRPDTGDDENETGDTDFISRSTGPINVIVVADTDLLADRFWVNVQSFLGMQIPSVFADNANFVINAVDMLGGNNDLISLRSRGEFARPFKVVEAIQRDAEAQFRDRERALQAKLEETETRLAELQTQQDGSGEILLTAEQREAIERFRDEQLSTRKQLREVQHDLRKNIERLGTVLKFVNIALIPLLLTVLAVATSIIRMQRA